jgi:hypothetical protein
MCTLICTEQQLVSFETHPLVRMLLTSFHRPPWNKQASSQCVCPKHGLLTSSQVRGG